MQDCYNSVLQELPYQVSADASGNSSRTSVWLKSVQEESLAQSTTRNRAMQSVLVFNAQLCVASLDSLPQISAGLLTQPHTVNPSAVVDIAWKLHFRHSLFIN